MHGVIYLFLDLFDDHVQFRLDCHRPRHFISFLIDYRIQLYDIVDEHQRSLVLVFDVGIDRFPPRRNFREGGRDLLNGRSGRLALAGKIFGRDRHFARGGGELSRHAEYQGNYLPDFHQQPVHEAAH